CAAWSRSFQPSGETFALAANNTDLAPEETTNNEVGAKWSALGGRLRGTAPLSDLTRPGIVGGARSGRRLAWNSELRLHGRQGDQVCGPRRGPAGAGQARGADAE